MWYYVKEIKITFRWCHISYYQTVTPKWKYSKNAFWWFPYHISTQTGIGHDTVTPKWKYSKMTSNDLPIISLPKKAMAHDAITPMWKYLESTCQWPHIYQRMQWYMMPSLSCESTPKNTFWWPPYHIITKKAMVHDTITPMWKYSKNAFQWSLYHILPKKAMS